MGYHGYSKLRPKWRRMRRSRINFTLFSIRHIRAKLFAMLGILNNGFQLLPRESSSGWQSDGLSGSQRGLTLGERYGGQTYRRLRSPSSFYAEAMSDCLEYIKRNSARPDNESESVIC
ncbi:uncharacterized protein A4U43_C01F33760 [Asparagus officinalis]|uniref:Uncharacterized protein n=1 Tax=Asparagus officinalis TaxID=4686 RepID=A0A5P1FU56_ASPOF|nr:uncharacterized protein A4U43_C01F33760 [Asparagus officinalis]